jgi:hypothetical protein
MKTSVFSKGSREMFNIGYVVRLVMLRVFTSFHLLQKGLHPNPSTSSYSSFHPIERNISKADRKEYTT